MDPDSKQPKTRLRDIKISSHSSNDQNDILCKVEKHKTQQKYLKKICSYSECLKNFQLYCDLCLKENHYDHKDNWIEKTDFKNINEKNIKILVDKIKESEIYQLDGQIKAQKDDWVALWTSYEREINLQYPIEDNIKNISNTIQNVNQLKYPQQIRQMLRDLQIYMKYDKKQKTTTLDPKKFDNIINSKIHPQIIEFNQKMRKTFDSFGDELTSILNNIGLKKQANIDQVSDDDSNMSSSTIQKQKRSRYWQEKTPKKKSVSDESSSSFSKSVEKPRVKQKLQIKKINRDRSSVSSSQGRNNAQNYGFDWATKWVEELPEGWQDLLEFQSKTPCIGLIVSTSDKNENIKHDNILSLIKKKFQLYREVQKEEKLTENNIVNTGNTIQTAKHLKALIKTNYKGEEMCVKTWGSRKMGHENSYQKPYSKYNSKYNDEDQYYDDRNHRQSFYHGDEKRPYKKQYQNRY